jgi:hypothetical protein
MFWLMNSPLILMKLKYREGRYSGKAKILRTLRFRARIGQISAQKWQDMPDQKQDVTICNSLDLWLLPDHILVVLGALALHMFHLYAPNVLPMC